MLFGLRVVCAVPFSRSLLLIVSAFVFGLISFRVVSCRAVSCGVEKLCCVVALRVAFVRECVFDAAVVFVVRAAV